MRLRNIIIAIVAGSAIGMGAWLSYQLATPPAQPQRATILPVTMELPDFALLDETGATIGADAFVGQWSLVFFGFTQCPDICPLTLQVLSSARRALSDSGQEPLPQIVLVSVDPERDTPEVMQTYLGNFGDGTKGVTGELDELQKLTKSLGIFFAKSVREDGSYSVDHSAVVLVINPDGQFHALFGAPHEIDNFVHDLPIIMNNT